MELEWVFYCIYSGSGTVEVLAYPSLRPVDTLMAHTAGCYCIAIDPLGRYFAVGSADSLVTLWGISEMLCVRTFTKLELPVRTISFNNTGEYLASASEDLFIEISNIQTGRTVHQIPWQPFYDTLIHTHFTRNTGPEGWRLRQRHFETTTSLVRSCRKFFPPGSAIEIWSEFRSLLEIHDIIHPLRDLGLLDCFFPRTWTTKNSFRTIGLKSCSTYGTRYRIANFGTVDGQLL
ncbi:hypothetical protein L3X38_030512 [Prunus dulcis]|uniref:Transducin/WD40 repeat-like superfamily protein n=1 Tax=Prunus dulcis TaxID=3755 RepID=A0AAD4YU42_PRUDU|nr:hypothetical protein L3X38_030512 [Prunus dulcis]